MRRDRRVLSGGTCLVTGATGVCYCRRSAAFLAYSRRSLPVYGHGFLLFPSSAEGVSGDAIIFNKSTVTFA